MARRALVLLSLITGLASLIIVHVYGEKFPVTNNFSGSPGSHFHQRMRKMQEFKASLIRRDLATTTAAATAPSPSIDSPSPSPSAAPLPPQVMLFTSFSELQVMVFVVVVVVVLMIIVGRLHQGHVCIG